MLGDGETSLVETNEQSDQNKILMETSEGVRSSHSLPPVSLWNRSSSRVSLWSLERVDRKI